MAVVQLQGINLRPELSTEIDGTTLLTETFADGSFSGRGWYDLGPTDRVASPAPPGKPGSLRFTWNSSDTAPSTGTMRKLFTASDRVYLRYQEQFSSNWVGTQLSYQPHMLVFLSDADSSFEGSYVHLGIDVEINYQSGNRQLVTFQDHRYVDGGHIGFYFDENRATCGANGQRGYADSWDVFSGWPGNPDTTYYNSRLLAESTASMAPGDTAWHTITVEIILNSISGGLGQLDGVCRYWIDGKLKWNRTNLEMRTGSRPTLKLNQFIFNAYMGDGSPVTQTFYVSDVELRTAADRANKLLVTTLPVGTDNVAFSTQPTVQLLDSSNRPVPKSGVLISAAIVSGTGSLIGTTAVATNSGGEAQWSNLGINATSPPSSFTLRFTAPNLTTIDSASFSVGA